MAYGPNGTLPLKKAKCHVYTLKKNKSYEITTKRAEDGAFQFAFIIYKVEKNKKVVLFEVDSVMAGYEYILKFSTRSVVETLWFSYWEKTNRWTQITSTKFYIDRK